MKLVDFYLKSKPVKGYVFNVNYKNHLPFNKVYLAASRWKNHIINKHPEITKSILQNTLEEADYIIQDNQNGKRFFHFRKQTNQFVIVAIVMQGYLGQIPKSKGYLLTAYSLDNEKKHLNSKYIKIVYDKSSLNYKDYYSDPDMFNFDFIDE